MVDCGRISLSLIVHARTESCDHGIFCNLESLWEVVTLGYAKRERGFPDPRIDVAPMLLCTAWRIFISSDPTAMEAYHHCCACPFRALGSAIVSSLQLLKCGEPGTETMGNHGVVLAIDPVKQLSPGVVKWRGDLFHDSECRHFCSRPVTS